MLKKLPRFKGDAARASLPQEQQALEKINDKLIMGTANCGKGLGSPLTEDLRELVNQTESLRPEWKSRTLECVSETFKLLAVDRKKNDKAKAHWRRLTE